MTNLARFTISGTPSSQGGYDVDPGETPQLQLEASAALVGRATFEVYSPSNPLSPRATPAAPTLTLTGATSGQSVDAASPSAVVTVSAGIPALRTAHAWAIRCKVDGGVNHDGSVNPDKVFERLMVMRSALGRRKIIPSERGEYSTTESWASAVNDFADEAFTRATFEPGLLVDLNADFGIETRSGYLVGWRDQLCGKIARPLTDDMVVNESTLSGGRRAVQFNGTTHGMTLEIPELRRNNASLIVAMHLQAGSSVDQQYLISLPKSENDLTSVIGLDFVGGGFTTRSYGHFQNDTFATVVNHTDPYQDTELVLEGVRDSRNATLHLFRNGVRRSGTEGTVQIDLLAPQPTFTTLYIGHDPSSGTGRFSGVIRRIAVYGGFVASQLVANAAARDALWRGH